MSKHKAVSVNRQTCGKVLGNGYSPAPRKCRRFARVRLVLRDNGRTRVRFRCSQHAQKFGGRWYRESLPLETSVAE